MLIYLPLEHLESRYTIHLDKDIVRYLDKSKIDYIRIYPDIKHSEIKNGSFLDAGLTINFKSLQIAYLSKLYRDNVINDGDVIFCSDIWFPGIESIAYLNYFYKKDVKLTGFLHAGSFTDTDFIRDLERWAKNFEDMIFDISDKIFVASNFIKNDVLKKRIIDKDKIIVSGLPLDSSIKYSNSKKEKIVIFNGRNVDEKQPWLFDELSKRLKNEAIFINTQKKNLSKKDYYSLLKKSKVVVSFALQENFGFGINEAVSFGCIPVLPNRLVYPEFYNSDYLYNDFDECVLKVRKALNDKISVPKINLKNPFKIWFNENINCRK